MSNGIDKKNIVIAILLLIISFLGAVFLLHQGDVEVRQLGEQITIENLPFEVNDTSAVRIGNNSVTIYGTNSTITSNQTLTIQPAATFSNNIIVPWVNTTSGVNTTLITSPSNNLVGHINQTYVAEIIFTYANGTASSHRMYVNDSGWLVQE